MFRVVNSDEINHRTDFALLCNERGVQVAVEIGTDRGVFASQFMQRYEGEELVCVDAYGPYDELPGTRVPDMLMAIQALQPWHGRVRMLQIDSPQVIEKFPWWLKNRLMFVYIDGKHDYPSVKTDIEAWWPILQNNGILAGHDYDDTHPGVKQAVDEFAKRLGLTVRIVAGDSPESWYIYKNEPKMQKHCYFRTGETKNPYRD